MCEPRRHRGWRRRAVAGGDKTATGGKSFTREGAAFGIGLAVAAGRGLQAIEMAGDVPAGQPIRAQQHGLHLHLRDGQQFIGQHSDNRPGIDYARAALIASDGVNRQVKRVGHKLGQRPQRRRDVVAEVRRGLALVRPVARVRCHRPSGTEPTTDIEKMSNIFPSIDKPIPRRIASRHVENRERDRGPPFQISLAHHEEGRVLRRQDSGGASKWLANRPSSRRKGDQPQDQGRLSPVENRMIRQFPRGANA